MKRKVVALDGPAGAGKSTVSRRLAQELRFRYIDTGAMYRVVGVLAHERGIDFSDVELLRHLCDRLDLSFEEREDGLHTIADGRDLSTDIRTPEAGQLASRVSTVSVVRERLVALQRRMGEAGNVVMEGRDIGTVVFPDAAVKFFLTASAEERGRRRTSELEARGLPVDLKATIQEISERDQRDQTRAHSPLRPAADARVVDTTGLSIDRVVAELRVLVEQVWAA